MTTIVLNGKDTMIDSDSTIESLLESMALTEKRLAIEVNQQIIPRSAFSSHFLQEQDKIEIVQAIGGGSPSGNKK